MGTGERLQGAGYEAVDRSAKRPCEDRDRHRDRDRLLGNHAADEAGDETADQDLAGAADVEEPRLEADTNGEAGQHERGGRGQGVRQRPAGLLGVDRGRERDRAIR